MDKEQLFGKLYDRLLNFDVDGSVEAAQQIVDNEYDVMEAIKVASKAVNEIGDQFEAGDIFLPQLMLAGKAMKDCMTILSAQIEAEMEVEKKGKVVIGAVSGDIHDIGKNLVATMLSVHGFDVVDMGVDAPPLKIIETAEHEKAQIIALSSLMTTSMPYQRDVMEVLQEMGVRDQFYVVVGGGPVTPEYANSIGADGWGLNAVAAVRVCEQLLKAKQTPPLEKTLVLE